MHTEKDNLIQKLIQSKEYIELELADRETDGLITENGGQVPYTFSSDLFGLADNAFSVMKNVYDLDVVLHRHDFYEIQYVYSGRVTQQINGKLFELEKGSLTVFNKNVAHSIQRGTASDRLYHIGIHESVFEPSFFNRVIETSSIARYLYQSIFINRQESGFLLLKCDFDFMLQLVEAMQREYIGREPGFEKNLTAYLTLLINKAPRTEEYGSEIPGGTDYVQTRLAEINVCLNEQYRDLTLGKLALALHVHPNYLSRFISIHLGRTYNELLTDIRIQKSRYMLAATDLDVEAISGEVGYENPNYFYKTFRKKQGITPAQYRLQCRKSHS